MKKPKLTVIDSCTIFWVVNWPTNRLVSDYIANYYEFFHDIVVVFDRYRDFSIKSATRADKKIFCKNPFFLRHRCH